MVKAKKNDSISEPDNEEEEPAPVNQNAIVSDLIKALSENPETAERYKHFKNSKIDYKRLKKFIENKFDVDLTVSSSIVIATTVKIFCGEIVERSRELMTKNKVAGPIKPVFMKQAYRNVVEKFKGPIFEKPEL